MAPRYWAFAYDACYPSGGIGDRIGMFDAIDDARAAIKAHEWTDFREIVDIESGEVAESDVR